MEIKHKLIGNKGLFYMEQEGKILAEMIYTKGGQRITIVHTEVSDALRGKGGRQRIGGGYRKTRQGK